MGLTDEVPTWIKSALRVCFYGGALFLAYQAGYAAFHMGIVSHTADCVGGPGRSARGRALTTTQEIAACLKDRNNLVQNLMMRRLHRAIDGLPSHPPEFVGVWNGVQPRCSYRHILKADGTFISSPAAEGCSVGSGTFRGYWGVVDGQMIWMSDERAWPPDINAMDVVDKDLILLTEGDGSRTKFSRALDLSAEERTLLSAPAGKAGATQAAAVAPGSAATPEDGGNVPPIQLTQWGEQRVEEKRENLSGEKFSEITLPKDSDWHQYLRPEQREGLLKILSQKACRGGDFSLFSKPGRAARAVVAHCPAHTSEYPLVIGISDRGVSPFDLSPHGFMYESGAIEAFTDVDNNGRIEAWLRGTICECDGEDDSQCAASCEGSQVVEETPPAPAALHAASSPA